MALRLRSKEARSEAVCDGPSECERDDCTTDDDSFFPAHACHELEAKLIFPTCWDGVNPTSEDMTSHVSYDTEGGWLYSCDADLFEQGRPLHPHFCDGQRSIVPLLLRSRRAYWWWFM